MTDSCSRLKLYCRIGVWPPGAHGPAPQGLQDRPRSSMQRIIRPSRAAFFVRATSWPCASEPLDRCVRAPRRPAAARSNRARRATAKPKRRGSSRETRFDQLRGPRQRPQLPRKAGRQCPFFAQSHQLLALCLGQSLGAPGAMPPFLPGGHAPNASQSGAKRRLVRRPPLGAPGPPATSLRGADVAPAPSVSLRVSSVARTDTLWNGSFALAAQDTHLGLAWHFPAGAGGAPAQTRRRPQSRDDTLEERNAAGARQLL